MNAIRTMLVLVVVMGAALVLAPRAEAKGAAKLAGLGYPELRITVTDDAIIAPETVAAGRTLIAYENTGQELRQSWLLRVPDDVTAAELAAPTLPGEPPEWFFRGTFVGFPGGVPAGSVTYAVVDLEPGLYAVYDDFRDLLRVVPPAGDAPAPAAGPDPVADAEVTMSEYAFEFPEQVAAGTQVWKLTNSGSEMHMLVLAKSPAPVTEAQIMELVMGGDFDAKPTGGGPSLNELEANEVTGFGGLSSGLSGWSELTLEPGTYVAICFAPAADGMPHVAMGMVGVFTVV